MNEDLTAALRRARAEKRWSIRQLAKESGVSTATIQRYMDGHDSVQPKTLDRITAALGLPSAVPVTGSGGEWRIPDTTAGTITTGAQESDSVVTDGYTVLSLRLPNGFLDRIPADERDDFERDALLEVMRLARAVERASRDDATRGSQTAEG